MEWAAAWAICGPDASEAEVTAVHLGEEPGVVCTQRDMVLARLHWLRLARIPTLSLVRSILPHCPTEALARHYPPSVPSAPSIPPGWTVEVVLAGHPGALALLLDVPHIRKVHVVSDTQFLHRHPKLQWHRPTVAEGSLGLELALRPLPDHVSILLLDPQRAYHPHLVALLLRASHTHGPQTLVSATSPPSLAGGLLLWPRGLGSGRRWSRLLAQGAPLPANFVVQGWNGPVCHAEDTELLPTALVSRTLQWTEVPHHAPLPPSIIDDLPTAETEGTQLLATPEQVLTAMRVAFPFCRRVWVEAAWLPGAAVFGVRACVTGPAPAPEPGAVLVALRARRTDWAGHQLVLGDAAAEVQLGPIGIYPETQAAPLRTTVLHNICCRAPEWKWRGWLYPDRLEGWLRLCPLLRSMTAPRMAMLGPVRHSQLPQQLPLLDELAQSLPELTLEREVTPTCNVIYAPAWALLPPHHNATWVLVDEPPHAGIPPRTVHMARGQQTLLGPPQLPAVPLAPEWTVRGSLTPATLRHLQELARTVADNVRAVVPLPVNHPETDRWLDERMHGTTHMGITASPAWSTGLFRQRGSEIQVCPAA